MAPDTLGVVEPGYQPFVSAGPPANSEPVLRQLPREIEAELLEAETELSGDGSAHVVHATRWRWAGPVAGELRGWITLRRCGPAGEVWDLVCSITVDPDDEQAHVDLVVRRTDEARLAAGLPPLAQWWAPTTVLRASERAAIEEEAASTVVAPPPRCSLVPDDAAVVSLRLDAGSLGAIAGELRCVGDLGLGYVRATSPGTCSPDTAARTLRAAVIDGRLRVPPHVRAWLDRGGVLLAVEGGPL